MSQEKIAVITDSSSDIPIEWREKYGIFVLPVVITHSQQEFLDGINITSEEIYEIQKTQLPKTSCPTGGSWMDTCDTIKSQGYEKAVVILMSAGISGTYNSIKLMAMQTDGLEIEVFDSKASSIGIGIIALQAAKYVQEGYTFEQLKNVIPKLIRNTYVYFSLDQLDYLQKGGRIGKVTAVTGALLNIKPILSFDREDGEIITSAKVRGAGMVEGRLLHLVEEARNNSRRYNLVVADGGMPEESQHSLEQIKEKFPDYVEVVKTKIGAALSVHLGKGLLGAGIQILED